MTALAFASQLLGALPALIAGGVEILGLIEEGNAKLKQFDEEKRDPTDLEWSDLNDRIEELRGELHS